MQETLRYRGVRITYDPNNFGAALQYQCFVVVRWMWDDSSFVYVLTPKNGNWLAAVKQLIDDDIDNTYGDSGWFNDGIEYMTYDVSLPTIITPERMCVFDREH